MSPQSLHRLVLFILDDLSFGSRIRGSGNLFSISVDTYVTTTSQEEKQGEARELGRKIASQNFTNLLPPK